MKNVEQQREKLRRAVRKYKLDMPISDQGKNDALASKRHVYLGILKKLGKYSSYMGLVIFLHYLIKKPGIIVTLNKTIVAVALTASTAIGLYYVAEHFQKQPDNQIVGIKSSSHEIILTEKMKKSEIIIFAQYKNNLTKNITNDIHIQVEPQDLLNIDKQKEKIIITAKKNGKALITVQYEDYQATIQVISKVNKDELKKAFIMTEKIYLKDGNIFTGRLVKDNDFYILITSDKKIKIHKDEIAKIEYIK